MEVPASNCATKEDVKKGAEDGSLLIIDVRNPSELEIGKIQSKRWVNIPYNEFEEAFNLSEENFKGKYGQKKPEKDGSDMVTNCGGGGWSSRALVIALKMGYSKARHLPGGFKGYTAWLNSEKS